MKKVVFVLGVALLMVSCGPSEAEVKQQVVDTAMQSVCDCFERNQGDWLAYRKECGSTVETMRFLIDDDVEGLKQFEAKIAECDKYFKEQ
ncbi:MAG: hypothetical protein P8Q14_08590 [Vicingaceae bacterium]|nr:hypothetical protein [Vicingaceae bacterium]